MVRPAYEQLRETEQLGLQRSQMQTDMKELIHKVVQADFMARTLAQRRGESVTAEFRDYVRAELRAWAPWVFDAGE